MPLLLLPNDKEEKTNFCEIIFKGGLKGKKKGQYYCICNWAWVNRKLGDVMGCKDGHSIEFKGKSFILVT